MTALSALRPVDGTAKAIRSALAAAAIERALAETKIAELRTLRQELLLTGTTKAILQTETDIRAQESWIDQIDALVELIEPDLKPAIGRDLQAQIKAKVQLALEAAAEAEAWARTEYPQLAAALVRGLQLDARAMELRGAAIEAVRPIAASPELQAAGGLATDLFLRFPECLGLLATSVVLPKFGDAAAWSRSRT